MANGFGFERIIINELDLTAQGFATENTNVAFDTVCGRDKRSCPAFSFSCFCRTKFSY